MLETGTSLVEWDALLFSCDSTRPRIGMNSDSVLNLKLSPEALSTAGLLEFGVLVFTA